MSDSRRQHGSSRSHGGGSGGFGSNIDKDLLPDGLLHDPYEVLGVSFEASEADIKKAYRKRALILHPDKQPTLTQQDDKMSKKASESPEDLANAFHELQLARAFLLDAEHASALQTYRRKVASRRARQHADAARDHSLSESRKRMRQELREREELARKRTEDRPSTSSNRKASRAGDDDRTVEELRRQGQEMREEYGKRRDQDDAEIEEEIRRRQRVEKEQRKVELENRQVRLKWSRKKMVPTSPSEHSLAELMKEFGEVENVELLGNKGNSALVTFRDERSCKTCVDCYAESDVMRASYVGKRKDRESQKDDEEEKGVSAAMWARRWEGGASESTEDWKLRRAAEREEIMRQMKEEEDDDQPDTDEAKSKAGVAKPLRTVGPFPPPLPSQADDEYLGLVDPLERLERAEEILLRGLVPEDVIRGLKVANFQVQRESESLSAGA